MCTNSLKLVSYYMRGQNLEERSAHFLCNNNKNKYVQL